jgi:hemolysin III
MPAPGSVSDRPGGFPGRPLDDAVAAAESGPPAKPRLRGWLHVVALVAVLVAGPLLILSAKTPSETAALSVYVTSLVGLFGVSALFHRVRWGSTGARRMRRADHSTIFLAISGTYTAVAALALHGRAQVLILVLVWGGSAVGLTLRQFVMDAPKWLVALPYVVVGWSALAVIPQLVQGASWPGFLLILAGGVAYTAGAVVYALRRPDPVPAVFGFHEVFHACTVVGALLHFLAIASFALPRS